MVIVLLVLVAGLGYFVGYSVSQAREAVEPQRNVVSIEVVPDFGGATYDAFVVSENVSGNIPPAGSGGAAQLDNSVTVPVGVPIRFVITSIDSAKNMNFSGSVTVPFTVYQTENGTIALNYRQGENISNLVVGHTFTIDSLGINIPIPPMTIVSFNYTFTQTGSFFYRCTIPCGLGMNLMGYMQGFVIAKPAVTNAYATATSFLIQFRDTVIAIANLPSIYLFQLFLLIAVSIVSIASADKVNAQ